MHGSASSGRDEHYEVLGEIATGGMATVYLGRLRRPMGFSRLVAIKSLHPQYAKDPAFATMFVDEARLTARLRHPNIVPTLDIVDGNGHLLLVMEYVEGEALSALLRAVRDAGERIPPHIACAIVHDTLLGLHEAHEAVDDDGAPLSIVHRDVSPQNVIVGLDGLARVLDFGVAKAKSRAHHSSSGEIKGKVPYMPPEQLFGETLDRRVDVYAAGIVLWESLTGVRLFDGASEEILVQKISQGPVDKPSARVSGLPAELDAIVMRALAREARDRFPDALAMAEALANAVALPTRTEISAWVRRFAKKAPVPASAKKRLDELATRPDAADIVAVLERNTVQRETPSNVPVFADPPKAAPRSALSRFVTTMVVGIGAVVLTLAGIAGASYANGRPAPLRSEPASAPIAAEAASVEPHVFDGPQNAEAPKAPLAPTAAPIVKTRPTAPRIAPPRPTAEAVNPPPDANQGDAQKRASCRPPYVLDGEGHRHYKVECL